MEIGEYLTNVVSTDDCATLRYNYLECPSTNPNPSRTALLRVVDAWRQLGALVIEDNTRLGIWIFGNVKRTGSLLPSPSAPDADGLVRVQGISFVVKEDETYTYDLSKSLQIGKHVPAGWKETGSLPAPSPSSDSGPRMSSPVSVKGGQITPASAASSLSGNTSQSGKLDNSHFAQRRRLKEHLIAAVLAALTYRLCHDSGCIALNARTLLLPVTDSPQTDDNRISLSRKTFATGNALSLITLDINLTAMGTLVLKASMCSSSYISNLSLSKAENQFMQGPGRGYNLLLAPTGKLGRYTAARNDEIHSSDDQDSTDSVRRSHLTEYGTQAFPTDEWKQRCLLWLSHKGIKVDGLDSGRWLMLQTWISRRWIPKSEDENPISPTRQRITVSWPESLCFLQGGPSSPLDPPASLEAAGNYDPLSFAQGWFMSRNEREATIAKRKKDREATEAAAKAQADLDAKSIPAISYSPVALRRASAAGMVYPTPPDAVQPTVGATPSFDGNASTPGQPPHQLAITETDHTDNATNNKGDLDLDGKLWDSNAAKAEPTSSGLEFNDNNNDNLFDDIGEDLFGENNITDADFSFFDEPDVFQGSQDNADGDEDLLQDPNALSTEEKPLDVSIALEPSNPAGSNDIEMGNTDAVSGIDTAQVTQPSIDETTSVVTIDVSKQHVDDSTDLTEPPDAVVDPPLSPELIFRRLSVIGSSQLPSSQHINKDNNIPTSESGSVFRAVHFNPSLSSFDEKYSANGRFNLTSWQKNAALTVSAELPQTDYLRRRQRKRLNAQEFLSQVLFSPLDKTAVNSPPDSSQSDFEAANGSNMASPSDRDDSSNTSDEKPDLFPTGVKRKREEETDDDYASHEQISSSFQDLNVEDDVGTRGANLLDDVEPNLLDPDLAEWSLSRLLQAPTLQPIPNSLTDDEYVAAAQLLADQAISRTLEAPGLTKKKQALKPKENLPSSEPSVESIQQKLLQACKRYFDNVNSCTLASFLEIPGASALSQPRLPPRPIPISRSQSGSDPFSNSIFTLPPPHLQVRRGDSKLTVLPPAISFWDSLGLAPCGDTKDVSALCIYPEGTGMADNAGAFLEQMRSAYESSRLGLHDRFSGASITDGLVALDLSKAKPRLSLDQGLSTIKETAGRVGNALASSLLEDRNFVVYCVYESSRPELLIYICSAFYHLLEAYKDALTEKKQEALNEVVLQLVPIDFLASHTSLVIPPPSEYVRLAMEVYDRCIKMESGELTPTMVLERPLPRTIEFKLTPNPSQSLLHENSCMHVAYAQSIDDRWITAAWTDNLGRNQMSASYCLGRKETPVTRAFTDVAHEIWETTLDVISAQKVHWRLFIVKCGVMDVSEMDFWRNLAATESKAQVSLTLLMVDTEPSLQLLPPAISFPPATLSAQSIFYTTPVSTPQSSSIVSPEQSGNATTPVRDGTGGNSATPGGGETNAELKIEPDATLVDVTDESWGAILSHRNNNSNSLLEFVATLMSGYLIKRGGSMPSDVPVVMEVNILHSELNSRVHEGLLKEILGYYRGLATLARARGVVDPVKDTRPWHIAAAEKGSKALYILM